MKIASGHSFPGGGVLSSCHALVDRSGRLCDYGTACFLYSITWVELLDCARSSLVSWTFANEDSIAIQVPPLAPLQAVTVSHNDDREVRHYPVNAPYHVKH